MNNLPENNTSFNHIPSQDELLGVYFDSARSDPRSPLYERKLVKPKLHIFRVLFFLLAVSVLTAGIFVSVFLCSGSVLHSVLLSALFLLVVFICFAKNIVIWLVKLYQNIAPAKVRNKCRFEPSCSQYMILSLEKYGFCKGLRKGFARWRKCKPPNGGIDYP